MTCARAASTEILKMRSDLEIWNELLLLNKTNPDLDEYSKRGNFGWTKIDGFDIPYILRKCGEATSRFILIKFVEHLLFKKYLMAFNQNLFSMLPLRVFSLTTDEAKLFNEINVVHCEYHFGIEEVNHSKKIMLLDEVELFCKFLKVLHLKDSGQDETTFGYIKLRNNGNFIPFYKTNGNYFVPQLIFEGDTNLLNNGKEVDQFADNALRVLLLLQHIKVELTTKILVLDFEKIIGFLDQSPIFTHAWVMSPNDYFINKTYKMSDLLIVLKDPPDFRSVFPFYTQVTKRRHIIQTTLKTK